jgi:alpha-D-ribose 1-methylphosphonate 5-triphosphate synthase subunit PhnG
MTEQGPSKPGDAEPIAIRRAWLGVLARSPASALEAIIAALPAPPVYTVLRPPEVGAVMLEGRAGGSGRRFNLGEATVTRCTIRLADGTAGVSYALGRDVRRAEAAAVLDALLQDPQQGPELLRTAITPLARAHADARALASRKAAATKVDFFTMVREAGG